MKAYAIFQNKTPILFTISKNKKDCLGIFIEERDEYWHRLVAEGYRIGKIEIKEIK